MTLGPQCWRCRKRRLRCDSSLPSCLKCTSAGTPCPGYGEKRPIAWRDPFVLTSRGVVRTREASGGGLPGSASVMGIMCRAPRSVGSELELRITVDAISYYNTHVAPDLVPYATRRSPYQISPSEVGELAEYLRKVYISIAALHKHVSGEPSAMAQFASDSRSLAVRGRARSCSTAADISELMATGDFKSVHFAAQVAALRALNEELQKHHSGDLEPGTLLGIMLVLSSQIQYSAYAPWQAHVHGAWCLITAQGGVEALARKNQDHCRVLQQVAVVDIFGMSTHRLTASSAETIIARHASYALILDKATADVLNPWTLMPNDLAKILDQINVLRAQDFLASVTARGEGLSDVLRTLDEVLPDSWAAEVAMNATFWLTPGKLSDDAESKAAWRALMEAFLHAAVLYAINSLAGMGTSNRLNCPYLISRETTAYETLMSAIRFLFRQRADRKHSSRSNPSDTTATSAGLLHKFVIWPMVVGGIQAALIHRDEATTKYLCSGMQSIGEELGTVSMIDGARLVAKLWSSGHGPASWDDIFDGAPLFLM